MREEIYGSEVEHKQPQGLSERPSGQFIAKRRKARAPYLEGTAEHEWHAICLTPQGEYLFRSSATQDGLLEALSDYDTVPNIVAIYEGKLRSFTEKRAVLL